MLSNVFITGRLGPSGGGPFRILETEDIIPGPDGAYATYALKVRCDRGPNALFMTAPEGALATIKGRIGTDEDGQLIVIDEIDEIYTSGISVQLPSSR